MFNSLQPHRRQHTRLPYPSLSPGVCSNSCPLSWWCHSAISSSVTSSPALNLSQHQGLFQWDGSSHQVVKVLEFKLQHQSFQWSISCFSHVQLFATPWKTPLWSARFLCLWNSPGKNTGVGCHFLLQGIFPTQGMNWHHLHLLYWRQILYLMSHQRNLRWQNVISEKYLLFSFISRKMKQDYEGSGNMILVCFLFTFLHVSFPYIYGKETRLFRKKKEYSAFHILQG